MSPPGVNIVLGGKGGGSKMSEVSFEQGWGSCILGSLLGAFLEVVMRSMDYIDNSEVGSSNISALSYRAQKQAL